MQLLGLRRFEAWRSLIASLEFGPELLAFGFDLFAFGFDFLIVLPVTELLKIGIEPGSYPVDYGQDGLLEC